MENSIGSVVIEIISYRQKTLLLYRIGKNTVQIILLNIAGILGDKTMDNELMYIPKNDKQIFTFCRVNVLVK